MSLASKENGGVQAHPEDQVSLDQAAQEGNRENEGRVVPRAPKVKGDHRALLGRAEKEALVENPEWSDLQDLQVQEDRLVREVNQDRLDLLDLRASVGHQDQVAHQERADRPVPLACRALLDSLEGRENKERMEAPGFPGSWDLLENQALPDLQDREVHLDLLDLLALQDQVDHEDLGDQPGGPDLQGRVAEQDSQDHLEREERVDLLDQLEAQVLLVHVDNEGTMGPPGSLVNREDPVQQVPWEVSEKEDREEKEVHQGLLEELAHQDAMACLDLQDLLEDQVSPGILVIQVQQDHPDPRERGDLEGRQDQLEALGAVDQAAQGDHLGLVDKLATTVLLENKEGVAPQDLKDQEGNKENQEHQDHLVLKDHRDLR